MLKDKRYKGSSDDPINTIIDSVALLTQRLSDPNGELFGTLRNVESITRQLRYGEGIIPSLYNSGELTNRVSTMLGDVHKILQDVDDVILIQNENVNRLINEDIKKLLVLAESNIHIISREVAIIIQNLRILAGNLQGTLTNLVLKSEEKVDIILNLLTKEVRQTISDISVIIKAILKDIALNTDPAVKSVITQVSKSVQNIISTMNEVIRDVRYDITGITKNAYKISGDVEVTIRDTSASLKNLTGKVGDVLKQVEKILVQLESSSLLGGGSGSSTSSTQADRRRSQRAFTN